MTYRKIDATDLAKSLRASASAPMVHRVIELGTVHTLQVDIGGFGVLMGDVTAEIALGWR